MSGSQTSADEQLARLQDELAAARAELQEFTYTVSHDLRAPLRHITSYVQVIQEDWSDMPADVADHLATIEQSAQLLARQLDGLTQLSRLGLQPLQLQAVDVGALVQEVAAALTQRLPSSPVQWQLARDVPLVRADAGLLRQVLMQVLDNALKFSRHRAPAQVALTWQLCPADQPAGVPLCQIRVCDNGVGFNPGQAQALFKVFGRLHPAREFEGLGLGLVTSRKIMGRLGGSIGMEAEPERGCCVTLRLPLAEATPSE
ncbi:ATP-binding protein [Rhodoferax sp.]|uniref:sensor histidine kinase n=1 Tax=Rhodoferax sp. TaxID=50421 RepID=UPI0026175CBB|nr:ATP-binding protein [Rhodoferax sp.]MDD2925712.1 ATP-binding protein [Rhodoferax sp.]